MARELDTIKKELQNNYIANENVKLKYELQDGKTFEEQFSPSILEAILFGVISFSLWTLEKLFDIHKQEVETIVDNKNPNTLKWFINLCKLFQYGFNLLPDSDLFDNEGKTEEQIEASKIVTHVAIEDNLEGILTKLAKTVNNTFVPLNDDELTAFTNYIQRVKPFGIRILPISKPADKLELEIDTYYNPIVLNANGEALGTTIKPVENALYSFFSLAQWTFNGEFSPEKLEYYLSNVEGVNISIVRSVKINNEVVNADFYTSISGFFSVDTLTIKYIAKNEGI